ncbi:MAG: hypothetical protein ACFCVG_07245 [Kineosporiaceae bacterium]
MGEESDDGRRRGLWGWQNEVWALLFGVAAFERLYRIAAEAPLEPTVGDGVLVVTAVLALGLTAWFAGRWWRERGSRGTGPGGPA